MRDKGFGEERDEDDEEDEDADDVMSSSDSVSESCLLADADAMEVADSKDFP